MQYCYFSYNNIQCYPNNTQRAWVKTLDIQIRAIDYEKFSILYRLKF